MNQTLRLVRLLIAICAFANSTTLMAEVPVMVASGYPMVPVEVAGHQHLFVLDTGAEGSAVYPEFAKQMALPVAKAETLVGQTGEAELSTRTIQALTFDHVHLGPISATELPSRSDGLLLPGIIGLDVIGDRVLDLNVPQGKASLLGREAAASLRHHLGAPVVARRVAGGLLAVPVILNGVSGWGVIDTGARETRVNSVFARRARLDAEDRPATSISGATQRAMKVTTSQVTDARFLGQVRRSTTVRVVDLPVFDTFGLEDQPAMLLGFDWLSRHRLIIDFKSASVWLR